MRRATLEAQEVLEKFQATIPETSFRNSYKTIPKHITTHFFLSSWAKTARPLAAGRVALGGQVGGRRFLEQLGCSDSWS